MFSVKEIASIIEAVNIEGDQSLIGEQIIIRAATASALPNSVYFNIPEFKEPDFPMERLYNLGVRIFVVDNPVINLDFFKNSAFIFVKNVKEAVNLYILSVIHAFKGSLNATDNINACNWLYSLTKPVVDNVFVTLNNTDERDFIENISALNNSFKIAVIYPPESFSYSCINSIKRADRVFIYPKDFSVVYSVHENSSDISVSQVNTDKSFSVCVPFVDEQRLRVAAYCLCRLIKQNLFKAEIHIPLFASLNCTDGQINMQTADYDARIISNFSVVNNLLSIVRCFDFAVRQHQIKNGITAVIVNPDSETLSHSDFFSKLLLCAKYCNISKIILVGCSQPVENSTGVKISKYDSIKDFINDFNPADFDNKGIIFKGLHRDHFADAFDLFNYGNHDTVLEVSLTALKHNLNYYRALLNKQTRLIAMVKADCYGSGAVDISNMLQNNGVDYLCVAFVEEGIALRRANITMPVIVMNYDGRNYKQLVNYNLEPVLFSSERVAKFTEILKSRHIFNYPVHIKLDTGMHRSGFMPDQLDALCKLINNNKDIIRPVSMFSHFVAADDNSEDDFSRLQVARFNKQCDFICAQTGLNPLRHICNSVGIERFKNFQYDMVRLGIGLYGVAFENSDKLMGISTWKTNIVQIKNIPRTETVGYNRKGKIIRDSRIALLPVGYADGLNRKFGNGTLHVDINGKQAPLIGNICMDMCMVDITDINCKVGDEVIIFNSNTKLIKMAADIQTIPYEILTGISPRVKRIYVE